MRRIPLAIAVFTLALAALLLAAAAPPPARAADADDVKAAFLVNFARYVEWPEESFASKGSPIVIGVLTGTELPGAVEAVAADRKIRGRSLAVRGFPTVEQVAPCHVLFIGKDREADAREAMRRLEDVPVFSIADFAGSSARIAMANFVRDGNKLRFEIDDRRARRAGLRVSSRLLRLGR